MNIELCVVVHNFEKRFSWQVNTVLTHAAKSPHQVVVNAAHVEEHGNPSVEEIFDFFAAVSPRSNLRFKSTVYSDPEALRYRGFVRNRQAAESEADWIVFSDCDMLFPEGWFDTLAGILSREENVAENRCLFTGRSHTDMKSTGQFLDRYAYPSLIENPMEIVTSQLVVERDPRNWGAGFCQIVRVAALHQRGHYVSPDDSGDRRDKAWNYHSDVRFRRSVGRKALDDLPWLIHLDHRRDKDFDQHLEEHR